MAAIERILILDENESNILFFEMVLQQMSRSFTVYTATTGMQAEVLVKNENIHMIICAWEMNAMPGTILVQKLKEHRNRHLPCLIFSKRMSEEDAALIRELGLNDVIGMPFDKQKATDIITKMIQREESITPVEKKLRKIETLIFENKPTEALKMVDASLTKPGPHLARTMALLGEIWISTRNLEKANECLTKALNEDPDNIHALRLMARLYSLQGNHEKAISMLEKMTEKSPSNIQSLISLGSAYIDANEHEKAKAVLKKVDKLDEDNQECKDQKGKLAFKEGNFALAAQLLAETNHGDELARNFNNMAIAKVANKQFNEGIEIYKNAIKLLANKAKLHQLYYNLGLAYRKKGDLADAFDKLCQSYLADSTFEKAYSALAKVSKEMKEKGEKIDAELVKKVKAVRSTIKESGEN